jgi:hypothetical protein
MENGTVYRVFTTTQQHITEERDDAKKADMKQYM